MLETSEPENSVEELMSRMLEGAARQRIDNNLLPKRQSAQRGGSAFDSPQSVAAFGADIHVAPTPLALQPDFEPHLDDAYSAADLLKYHDKQFVQNAYRAILKRAPDAAGFKKFIENLRSGRLDKIDVLAQLRYSPEGKAKNVRIDGLRHSAAIRSFYRVPLIGYLAQLIVLLARLPALLHSRRQFEAYAVSQLQMITDHFNNARTESIIAIEALGRVQQRQQLAYDEIKEGLSNARQSLEENLSGLREHTDAALKQVSQYAGIRFAQLGERVDARLLETNTQLQKHEADQQRRLEHLAIELKNETARILQRHQETRSELALQARRISLVLEDARRQLDDAPNREQLQILAEEDAHTLDALYISLEDELRGSRAEIIERLKIYVPLLKAVSIGGEAMPVLDIGCGRGEWLELLKAEGLQASGVDSNSIAIAQCRKLGLDAKQADALEYLRSLPDKSAGAITGFHIVEHLPFDVLMKLLDETVRVVKPGGAVIFETPNPQNVLVGSCNFYFDPTHRNPLPSPVMKFLIESRGFARVSVMNLHPSTAAPVEGDSELVRRFNEYFYGAMDYAVIGWKTSA